MSGERIADEDDVLDRDTSWQLGGHFLIFVTLEPFCLKKGHAGKTAEYQPRL